MRPGIFGRTFHGTDPEAVLDRVAAAGYAAVQWNWASAGLPSMPDVIPVGLPRRITEAASGRGLALAGVSGTTNLIHPDPAERARGLARLRTVIATAPALGAPLVTLCTGTRDPQDMWRAHPANADLSAWADLLTALEQVLPAAESADIRLGIEPEAANVVRNPTAARRLLAEIASPALTIVLDPANLWGEGPAPEDLRDRVTEAVDLLGERIAMVHAKDRDASGEVVAAGQGVVDWDHFAECLHAAGFDGDVVTHGLFPRDAHGVAAFLKGTFE